MEMIGGKEMKIMRKIGIEKINEVIGVVIRLIRGKKIMVKILMLY